MDAEDTLVVEDPSMCPEEFKVKMEQAFFGPLDADTDETRFAPPDLTRRYLAFTVTFSQNKYVRTPRLLSEMPPLRTEMATADPGVAGASGPDTSGAGCHQLAMIGKAPSTRMRPAFAPCIQLGKGDEGEGCHYRRLLVPILRRFLES